MKTKGAEFIWLDGKLVKWEDAKVPIFIHALHYGTAIFEGIRAYSSKDNKLYVFRLAEHMERLHRSAQVYRINVNYSAKELCDATVELLKKNSIFESCYIRPINFVGVHGIDLNVTLESPTNCAIIVFPFARYFNEEGIKVGVSSWRRINDTSIPPMAKASGNYLNSVLATQESKRHGFDESIMLDQEGNISEAPGENIFLVRDHSIYTPFIGNSALEGITRNTAFEISANLGYNIVERPISRTELYMADEIFLTGTAAEIVGILSVDGHPVGDGREGQFTRRIRQAYSRIVTGEEPRFSSWLTSVW
jgi:branched-chain amino acid aminotransferase